MRATILIQTLEEFWTISKDFRAFLHYFVGKGRKSKNPKFRNFYKNTVKQTVNDLICIKQLRTNHTLREEQLIRHFLQHYTCKDMQFVMESQIKWPECDVKKQFIDC